MAVQYLACGVIYLVYESRHFCTSLPPPAAHDTRATNGICSHRLLYVMKYMYNGVQTFESLDRILKCDHSYKSWWAVLPCPVKGGSKFESVHEILKCDHSAESIIMQHFPASDVHYTSWKNLLALVACSRNKDCVCSEKQCANKNEKRQGRERKFHCIRMF